MSQKKAEVPRKACEREVVEAIARRRPDLVPLFRDAEISTQILHDGEILNESANPGKYLHVVVSGCLKQSVVDFVGDVHIADFYVEGDIIGIDSGPGQGFWSSITAYGTVFIASLPLATVLGARTADRQFAFCQAGAEECMRNKTLAFYVTTKTATARLAWFLLNLIERRLQNDFSENTKLRLPMPRADIARYLGLASETVSREFSSLSKSGVINVDNRIVSFRNIAKLRRIAGVDVLEELAA